MKTEFKTTQQLIDEKSSFISAIPNTLGINLCNVAGVETVQQENGELISMRFIFLPAEPEPQEPKMDFGKALEAIKQGKAVTRMGWNGNGMSIHLNKGSIDPTIYGFMDNNPDVPKISTINGVPIDLFGFGDTGITTRLPNIDMKTASGSVVHGWLASQIDILAEDWEIIE